MAARKDINNLRIMFYEIAAPLVPPVFLKDDVIPKTLAEPVAPEAKPWAAATEISKNTAGVLTAAVLNPVWDNMIAKV